MVYEAKQLVGIEVFRREPKIFELAQQRIKQQLAETLFANMEAEECRAFTLRPMHRTEDKGTLSVKITQSVEVKELVRCQECKHHLDLQYHYCTKWGKLCPDDSEFFCAWGERKVGGQDK